MERSRWLKDPSFERSAATSTPSTWSSGGCGRASGISILGMSVTALGIFPAASASVRMLPTFVTARSGLVLVTVGLIFQLVILKHSVAEGVLCFDSLAARLRITPL